MDQDLHRLIFTDGNLARSVCCRFPVWTRFREAEPHDAETESTHAAQPGNARPGGRAPGSDGHPAGSGGRHARTNVGPDEPDCERTPGADRLVPAATCGIAAEPRGPAGRPPAAALPARWQVGAARSDPTRPDRTRSDRDVRAARDHLLTSSVCSSLLQTEDKFLFSISPRVVLNKESRSPEVGLDLTGSLGDSVRFSRCLVA